MGGRFKFLKKFSSKVDKLFLGDMIKSNKSDSQQLSKDYQHFDSSINSNKSAVYDYDNPITDYENYKNYDNEYIKDYNQNYVKNYDDKYDNYDRYNNYDSYYDSNNQNTSNFEDRYSDYIRSDEFNKEYIPKDFYANENYLNNIDEYSNPNNFNGIDSNRTNYNGNNPNKNNFNGNNSKISKLSSFTLKDLKNKLLNSDESSKKNFGIIAISLIILVLGASVFYFGIFQPFQNELNTEKTAKLNELNTLYKGPLAINSHVFTLENRIQDSYDINEIKSIDILRTATGDWRKYHFSKINACEDSYGRIMMSYSEDSKKALMPVEDATLFVNENDAKVLSNVIFGKVDTVIVPVYITRLQATGGLISVGSIVDIYSLSSNDTDYSSNSEVEDNNNSENMENDSNSDLENNSENISDNLDNNSQEYSSENAPIFSVADNSQESRTVSEEPDVSGATVLAILRSKDGGVIDSSFTKSTNLIKGNKTYPTEDSSSFSTDAEELLKSSIFNGHDNGELSSYLNNYGIKLSNYERLSNIGELDTDYLVLLEVPRSDVDFVINNMENLILTIPTEYAPNWAVNELNATYYRELNNKNNF